MEIKILGDRYDIIKQLGKKSGRRTLLARDRRTQELVVIKLLFFGSDFEWDDLKLFEREASILQALSHPAIPQYLNHFEIDLPQGKGFALVQSYIQAKSLEEHLKNGRTFREVELKEVAKALLEILIDLHGRQPPVIHRDIKPSNILLTNRSAHSIGQVYLVDFGSVQTLAAREGGTMTVVGTYGYMPPEQFGGRGVPASDLYSLGATLIYLVTGTHPADLPQQELRIQFEKLSNLSPSLNRWLKRMTHPSLERRFSSAFEALEDLQRESATDIDALAVTQPVKRKFLVKKDEYSIETIAPPTGFTLPVAAMSFGSVSLIFWLLLNFSNPANPMTALLFLPYLVPLGIMGERILFAFFGRYRLRIDWRSIAKTYELFGFKRNLFRPARRRDITKIEYIHSASSHPKIVIWAGGQKYEFGSAIANEAELEWLANELSDWLELPLTRNE
ncbi:serine/threonine protein kinase [Microseira wollei]|uniref:Serine/Threonine protein kinase n=1 Tax=Microseira wollei NIES-4236 TaxID=2530354 RepID=A0AAV3X414_9CYAN|nr:serine/threonine-protein kinase [Microseira wollei]GET35911.1 serine/Threonine protein kinase [Microseira wollei NIES-4236]